MNNEWGFLLVIIVGIGFLFFCGITRRMEVVETRIVSSKIHQPIRMVVLADLHCSPYGSHMEELLQQVKQCEPDVILIPGDLIDDRFPWTPVQELLTGLSDYPIYYVLGNHEMGSTNTESIRSSCATWGAHVLEGDRITIKIKDTEIELGGVEDFQVSSTYEAHLEQAAAWDKETSFHILLVHWPKDIPSTMQRKADLVISGHAHGGQFVFPFTKQGLWAPTQGFLPKYTQGLYQFDQTSFYVSRGLARINTKIPRFHNAPELSLLLLEPVDNKKS